MMPEGVSRRPRRLARGEPTGVSDRVCGWMPTDPPRPGRVEPPDVAELRSLRRAHPELAPAIDLQAELVEFQRRLQSRIPTPVALCSQADAATHLAAGKRLLELSDLAPDWSDLRLAVRKVADILRRHDNLDGSEYTRIVALIREEGRLERLLEGWYAETSAPVGERGALAGHRAAFPAILDQILSLALRPFLAKSTELAGQGLDLAVWKRPWCPFCGAEPEFAVLTTEGARLLTCGRCEGRWPWEPVGCPYCGTLDPAHLVTLASPDGQYRVYACNVCRRYLKAYDGRGARRPAIPVVDTIATLPLDAAAMQRGYGL
jgi:Protein involved in formate dehydrogenase formation